MSSQNLGKIEIFKPKGAKVALEVQLKKETVWLNLNQMARVFERDKSVISRHLRNIFKEKELHRVSVVANFATTAVDGKVYQVEYYNLDAIISVGYRVNSKRGTQFRIWATNILKHHLIQGYTINKERLREQSQKFRDLQKTVSLLAGLAERKALNNDEVKGLFAVIRDYSYGLGLLDDYDHARISLKATGSREYYRLSYEDALRLVSQMQKHLNASGLFGRRKDESFKSSVAAIYQTFKGRDLYPSIEEKAANLLYLVVKNHSFIDGNKRIAAALFLWFLERNKLLYRKDGSKRLADNALVAITLLTAESLPVEKDTIVRLIVNLINKNN